MPAQRLMNFHAHGEKDTRHHWLFNVGHGSCMGDASSRVSRISVGREGGTSRGGSSTSNIAGTTGSCRLPSLQNKIWPLALGTWTCMTVPHPQSRSPVLPKLPPHQLLHPRAFACDFSSVRNALARLPWLAFLGLSDRKADHHIHLGYFLHSNYCSLKLPNLFICSSSAPPKYTYNLNECRHLTCFAHCLQRQGLCLLTGNPC